MWRCFKPASSICNCSHIEVLLLQHRSTISCTLAHAANQLVLWDSIPSGPVPGSKNNEAVKGMIKLAAAADPASAILTAQLMRVAGRRSWTFTRVSVNNMTSLLEIWSVPARLALKRRCMRLLAVQDTGQQCPAVDQVLDYCWQDSEQMSAGVFLATSLSARFTR